MKIFSWKWVLSFELKNNTFLIQQGFCWKIGQVVYLFTHFYVYGFTRLFGYAWIA